MPATDLRLPPGVHVCRSGYDYVFLDRQRDAYTGIAGPNATALDACLAGGRPEGLEPLYAEGLLARADAPGRPFAISDAALPERAIVPGESAGFDPRSFAACLRADRLLRRGPFERVCQTAERAAEGTRPAASGELDAAAAAFAGARRFYPHAPACLFEALALRLDLARRGLASSWVFGVRLAPWAAHCWVEWDGQLVGAELETVAGFTPIMRL